MKPKVYCGACGWKGPVEDLETEHVEQPKTGPRIRTMRCPDCKHHGKKLVFDKEAMEDAEK